ncbi:DUF6415 family natural product biosynthesis protein [Streptomyces albireticuli]|uniref:Uncharacterized protein n=1 Tax=Streptomyces albireticuli TaxID=1940 RepID=A0A2A2D8Y9_9ACTN|nr:DUF6415 family natural product biosynthesis protein [Streptomyces albireticuli]MCD9145915.1 DUF6415 family natural product biosynthesis protein [Streptomyces albireticuli]MCD9166085.1 DUF6415 family natural product biosynthesis protein [Streptomyces albireticuli]MCD9196365.1 DUF6415 family natural product biosynthesis protein [Streptomyces albireticuli]PAU47984.1 hypothetical protein CK936_15865 [Streptomyces albireticuli]
MTTTSTSAAAKTARSSRIRVDGPDGPVMVDVDAIEQRIDAGMRPVIDAVSIDPAEITRITKGLVGDVEKLLPVAEARFKDRGGHITLGLDSLRRRLDYQRPDPRSYPLNAAICAADLARSCRTLLKLLTGPEDPNQVVISTW